MILFFKIYNKQIRLIFREIALCYIPIFYLPVRVIVFAIVWGVTFGKHHLWIFPNLTEDVGIIDSFKPFYHHSVAGDDSDENKSEDVDKKEKPVSSKNDDNDDKNSPSDPAKGETTKTDDGNEKSGGAGADPKGSGSGTEGDSTQDESNGYEIVGHDDVEKDECQQ